MQPFSLSQGDGPLILAAPHVGTHVPDDILARLNDNGKILADTDWHVDRLYDGLVNGATILCANFHRYVIDANRSPSNETLYPGQNSTGLCPVTDFDGAPIYYTGMEPEADEVEARRLQWHKPYHDALTAQMERIKARHGFAILYDCHSIRSHIPFLFDGKLPDMNIGTDSGKSCDSSIEKIVHFHVQHAKDYQSVLNGRFKGGWTTRHYGQPEKGFHAIQMELAQSIYLKTEEPPFAYDEAGAEKLRAHLKNILHEIAALAPSLNVK